jgi:Kef-type K+ transport system membrane component KefB
MTAYWRLHAVRRFATRRPLALLMLFVLGGPASILGVAIAQDAIGCPLQEFPTARAREQCQGPWLAANAVLGFVVVSLGLLQLAMATAHYRVKTMRKRLGDAAAPLAMQPRPVHDAGPPAWHEVQLNGEALRSTSWIVTVVAAMVLVFGLVLLYFFHVDLQPLPRSVVRGSIVVSVCVIVAAQVLRRLARGVRTEAMRLFGASDR